MRVLVFPLFFLAVAGCALEPYRRSNAPQSSDLVVNQMIAKAFAEAKLPGTPEVSDIRPAHPISAGDWLICLRSSDSAQRLRYAIYFTGSNYVRSQLASVVDRCDEVAYLPLGATPATNSRIVSGEPLRIGEVSAQKK